MSDGQGRRTTSETPEQPTRVQTLDCGELMCHGNLAAISEKVGIQPSILSYGLLHPSHCGPAARNQIRPMRLGLRQHKCGPGRQLIG